MKRRPKIAISDRDELLTIDVVADRLKFTPGTIRNWIAQGRIPYVRVSNRIRIPESSLAVIVREFKPLE